MATTLSGGGASRGDKYCTDANLLLLFHKKDAPACADHERKQSITSEKLRVRNLIYHGDGQSPFLIDFGTAVVAVTGCFSAVDRQSIVGTPTFIA